ncbi:MAG: hypothetical protein ACPGWR_17590, partial [Ardenticatenaceae bacterium]
AWRVILLIRGQLSEENEFPEGEYPLKSVALCPLGYVISKEWRFNKIRFPTPARGWEPYLIAIPKRSFS